MLLRQITKRPIKILLQNKQSKQIAKIKGVLNKMEVNGSSSCLNPKRP